VPPDSTLEAIGGRQALTRARRLLIDAGNGSFEIPVPSLIGAIVIKARVVGNAHLPDARAKHERDLARLLSLLTDPIAERVALSRRERRYLRDRSDLLDVGHSSWTGIRSAGDGALALSLLTAE
jgi:hypothetical protein